MTTTQRESLRELLRRVDEVRGLAGRSETRGAVAPDDADTLISTLGELVEELERSHRRVIETNVQLVSLREVASSMVSALDPGETSRTVTRYLRRAFDFDEVSLMLINRETGCLEGTWTHGRGDREQSNAIALPLLGDHGALARCVWLNRTIVHHDPRRHPAALVPGSHPLNDVFARIGSLVCVPLQRSHPPMPVGEAHELCGGRCILGDAALLAPPPPPGAESWAAERDERQTHCLGCELMPILGVIGVGRGIDAPPLRAADVTLVESIAMSVAPVVENARLTQELRKSERFRDHVLDSMASALVAVNMKGEILTFNHAAEQLLGHGEAGVLGQGFGELFGEEGDALVRGTLEYGREARRVETLLHTGGGTRLPVSLTTSLLRNEKGAIYGAIATFVDLTPLKRAEEHARRQDRLAALGRFTSSVAHEIRNPLTGIAAGVQYLTRSLADQGPQRENLDFILSEIKRLDRIVQDLFDITHPRGLSLRVQSLEDTLRRALHSLEPAFVERGVEVKLVVTPGLPPVPHDADQMQQVFINLIKNAAEASSGAATVTVALAAGPGANGSRVATRQAPASVVAQVIDYGCGISAEHLKTVFEPFFTTKPGGTGLGLYITHDIIKRHAGSLSVHSEPGRGTTFTMELPLESHGGTT